MTVALTLASLTGCPHNCKLRSKVVVPRISVCDKLRCEPDVPCKTTHSACKGFTFRQHNDCRRHQLTCNFLVPFCCSLGSRNVAEVTASIWPAVTLLHTPKKSMAKDVPTAIDGRLRSMVFTPTMLPMYGP